MASGKKAKDELNLMYYIKAYSIKDLVFSSDILRAFICVFILSILIIYFTTNFETPKKSKEFYLNISEPMLSNSISINSALLGLIIASIAIFASFSRPELMSKLYYHKEGEKRLHQYILVLFYPAIPAIVGIFFSFVGNVLLVANSSYTLIIALISVFFTFYCIFGVWASIRQIADSIVSQAKTRPR